VIFVTVGAQMPFDRLVRAVDDWASADAAPSVVAQIGTTSFVPKHMTWTTFMDPAEYRRAIVRADLIVAHAGMGTIITALEMSRPLLMMPRRFDHHETRNDHQTATAVRFATRPGLTVAHDVDMLIEHLEHWPSLVAGPRAQSHASYDLLDTVRHFIDGGVSSVLSPASLPFMMPTDDHDSRSQRRAA